MTSESKKPSELLKEMHPKMREALLSAVMKLAEQKSGYEFTTEERSEFEASDDGRRIIGEIEIPATIACVVQILDDEAERRAAFEADVIKRIERLAHAQTGL